MPVKSVVSIEIDDERFKRYKDLFDAYNAKLAQQPKMWGDVGAKQQELVGHFQKMTAALMAQSQIVREVGAAGDSQNAKLSRAEGLWSSIFTASRGVLSNVTSTAEGLLKWTGILSMLGGLLGLGGGIFGIDKLATSTADKRRRALGFGMSIGQVGAFDTSFSRLIDTEGFLGNLNAMEVDVTKQWPAYALLGHGLSGNTGSDALAMLTAARNLARGLPTNLVGTQFEAMGLNFSPDEMRRLQGSNSEFQELMGRYQKGSSMLDIQDRIAKGWQDVVTQWETATKEIAAILADKLAPLQGPLTRMSEALVKATEDITNMDAIADAIKLFGSGLDWLSDKISHLKELFGEAKEAYHHPGSALWGWIGQYTRNPNEMLRDVATARLPGGETATRSLKDYNAWLASVDQYYKLPSGTLEFFKNRESPGSMDPTITNPKSGAVGLFQFMPHTAGLYGLDPKDPLESARGAGDYLVDLIKKYHRDMDKVVAAYNYGPGNLDALIAAHPTDWRSKLPKETRDYVSAYDRAVSTGRIVIEDKTGGNVVVTVSGLAQ